MNRLSNYLYHKSKIDESLFSDKIGACTTQKNNFSFGQQLVLHSLESGASASLFYGNIRGGL